MNIFSRFRRNKELRGKTRNELFQILYSYLVGNRAVVFYSFAQQDFISKGYVQNSEVYTIINKITSKAEVATPYVYVDREGVKNKQFRSYEPKEILKSKYQIKALEFADEDNDLVKLLATPNNYQTWREFSKLMRVFYFVQGETFVYREAGDDGCAISLHVAPAHLMTPIMGGDYENPIAGWKLDLLYNNQERDLNVDDVMHFKMPNPDFDMTGKQLRGMSPLLSGLKYLQLDDKALEAWIKSVENEGAKGIISPNHANPELWLTPEQVVKTEEAVQNKIHGTDNKNKVAVSGMPLQYTHIGLSPDAMNIIQGLEHAQIKLCDLWGVPAVLFDPNPTYANQDIARKRFVLEVILPYLNSEEDKLNKWLVEPFRIRDGKNYIIDYDLSAYDELKLSLDDAEKMLKTHTINEVRVMMGFDELDEEYANQVFVQSGLMPLSDYSVEL